MVRVLPLWVDRERVGAIVLCRDVSDVRSKERLLVTKDATIREIHHRVKNNLQTVAALLRMQSRRISSPEAKVALNDAMSRVSSIAIVHETLSQAFDEIVEFDRVADGLLRMVGEVAASWGGVSAVRQGSFGLLSADVATSLAMIITELCQNAVEHGLATHSGEVRVVPHRCGRSAAGGDQRRRPRAARGLRPGARRAAWACPSSPPWSRDGGLVRPRPAAGRTRDAGRGRHSDLGRPRRARWTGRARSLTSLRDRYSLWNCLPQCRGVGDVRTPHRHRFAGRWSGRRRRYRTGRHPGWGRADHGRRFAPTAAAAAAAPTGGGSERHQGLEAKHSLRAPVTDENFYFVMADRFENGDHRQRHRRDLRAARLQHGFDPTNKGFYNGGDLKGLLERIDYIRGSGHDLDLADPELQEQGGAARGRPVGRLPRLLGHRLHPDRPAPGHQRRAARAGRRRPRAGDEGLLRHHHQPHRRRDRLRGGGAHRVRAEGRRAVPHRVRHARSTTATTPAPTASRRWTRRCRSRTRRCWSRARRTSRFRAGSTTSRCTTTAATPPSSARTPTTATSSVSTTCSPSTRRWSTG